MVLKKFQDEKWKDIEEALEVTLVEHTRKQVQMCAVAKAICERYAKANVGEEIHGSLFEYIPSYYSELDGIPVTIEPFLNGNFDKFVNNNGRICQVDACRKEKSEKSEALVHYSYESSKKKLMLLDIQGVNYKLSDPEIATLPEKDGNFEERLFCSGNLGEVAIDEFIKGHKCNKFCDHAGLAPLRDSSSLVE